MKSKPYDRCDQSYFCSPNGNKNGNNNINTTSYHFPLVLVYLHKTIQLLAKKKKKERKSTHNKKKMKEGGRKKC